MLDRTAGKAEVWRLAVVLLIVWSAIEATACAFGLRPTISRLLSDLTGFTINFACIQVLKDAISAKKIGDIVNMILVQIVVALFEVLFLYQTLIDATAPWLAEQGVALGSAGTLVLANVACFAVRGMTWYVFGRAGARALIPLLGSPHPRN